MKKAEILSIGSELTSGQNLDTNSQWLSLRLAEMGIAVGWHTTIADDLTDNVDAIRIATQRAPLVIITGGLGPTLDDLTREALAHLAGVELVFHEESLAHIQQMFARRQRPMPERNRVQALFPAGSEPLPNRLGTAPGIFMRFGESVIFALPGVPSEMFGMFQDQVKPRLGRSEPRPSGSGVLANAPLPDGRGSDMRSQLGLAGGVLVQRKINTFGAGESHIEEKLFDLTRRGHIPEVGITVQDATVSLRIIAHGTTLAEAQSQIAPVEATIRQRLGNLVFGVDEDELQHAVMRLLAARKKSLATAESITGGLVAQRLTQVPGASEWFRGGVVAYDSRVKVALLDVPPELIERHSAVSAEVVQSLAEGCRKKLGSDLGVSTVGYAGPTALADQPVGLVYAAVAWEGAPRCRSSTGAGRGWRFKAARPNSRSISFACNWKNRWAGHSVWPFCGQTRMSGPPNRLNGCAFFLLFFLVKAARLNLSKPADESDPAGDGRQPDDPSHDPNGQGDRDEASGV